MTDWNKEIDEFLAEDVRSRHQIDADKEGYRAHAAAFISGTVLPAFEQLKANLEQPRRDRCVDIQHVSMTSAQLTIGRPAPTAEGHEDMRAELQYTLELAIDPTTGHGAKIVNDGDGPARELFPSGSSDHFNQALIINDVLRHWQEAVRK